MAETSDPVLVEVLRGDRVESRHRGAVVVVDADGGTVLALGDVEQAVFPRSAVKAIQALPLVETGAADAYRFGQKELALACASHSGEAEHVRLAASMLERAGLDESALECGTHWPTRSEAARELAREGREPSALHNNCSGKHSGFLCACGHEGHGTRGYVKPGHWIQEEVRAALEAVTGAKHGEHNRATDGCAIPTYAVPLRAFARGFARMASGQGLEPARAAAATRLMAACMAEPFHVAGTRRADTLMMEAGAGRLFTKTGAEGVFCAAIPELGLGIAIKCDDGAARASEAVVAEVCAGLFGKSDPLGAKLAEMARPAIRNWNGETVGSVRPTSLLS
ncbi:MAG: asparaginase [Methylobacterium mesophilicum]|nr:asparaginase [Methylobacterium mesophilicum]